ncbi:hypothetical protein [Paraflavitalea speifideaquila]|uniref:hypothetical protein n=1 Tax=Paraflavitalea speifideaquila TaxID=3076558 RepID=UPI0028E1BD6F|nr:hypothetical protein [Paraflavitalea speifideiaquila]
MAGLVGVAGIIMIGLFVSDRCSQGDGVRNCIAGAVNEIVGSFSETTEDLFPLLPCTTGWILLLNRVTGHS